MPVKIKRKELEKLGVNLPQMKRLFTTHYISMSLVSDDIEIISVRSVGKYFTERYIQKFKNGDELYEKLKEFYFSKL